MLYFEADGKMNRLLPLLSLPSKAVIRRVIHRFNTYNPGQLTPYYA